MQAFGADFENGSAAGASRRAHPGGASRRAQAGALSLGPDADLVTLCSPDVNAVLSEDGVFRYVTPSCSRMFGWSPLELVGRHRVDLVDGSDRHLLEFGREDLRAGFVVTTTYRFLCRDGTYRRCEEKARRVNFGGEQYLVAAIRDISSRGELELSLHRQAFTDPLTGVGNRVVLMDRLRHALRRLERGSSVVGVLFLDLDRFKVVNDALGHSVGDVVLVEFAERISSFLRPADTLARLGGDEFVIVAEDVPDAEAAFELANRIVETGRIPLKVGPDDLVCTLSIGVSCTADSGHGAEALLHEADLALYRAKGEGRDRAAMFDEDLRRKAVGRLATESLVRKAIDESRLVVEYQPLVDLASGCAAGAEALVRLSDPEQGLVKPEVFLGVAEETGLLGAIDRWVIGDVLRTLGELQERTPGTRSSFVAVNLAAKQLADAGFAPTVVERLDACAIPRPNLQIEIPERLLLEASSTCYSALRELRDAGVRVALDDFGTGYASLALLRRVPLDYVKLDGSAIDPLGRSVTERSIVAAVIEMCHALGLGVIAESVETERQLAVLCSLGCDLAQGALFAGPVDGDQLGKLLDSSTPPPWADLVERAAARPPA